MDLRSFALISLLFSYVFGQNTEISINGENFYINGKMTYESAEDSNVKGLLINSRMVNAIFDDYNKTTVPYWHYPDTNTWDPMRNTMEFVGNMSLYRSYNLLGFTLGLQGGRPSRERPCCSCDPQPWINSAFNIHTADLDDNYMQRLEIVLSKADELGIIVILQFFYGGQIRHFDNYSNDTLIYKSIDNIVKWLSDKSYKNIMIDVANECNVGGYDGTVLTPSNMSKTIQYVQNKFNNSHWKVGTTFTGGHNPPDSVIDVEDIILVHGNGQSPQDITNMINTIRSSNSYKNKPKPIIFTEDFNTDTVSSSNNMKSAIQGHSSWGFMTECNSTDNGDYIRFYQCPPTAWNIDTQIKQNFFNAVKNYTKS